MPADDSLSCNSDSSVEIVTDDVTPNNATAAAHLAETCGVDIAKATAALKAARFDVHLAAENLLCLDDTHAAIEFAVFESTSSLRDILVSTVCGSILLQSLPHRELLSVLGSCHDFRFLVSKSSAGLSMRESLEHNALKEEISCSDVDARICDHVWKNSHIPVTFASSDHFAELHVRQAGNVLKNSLQVFSVPRSVPAGWILSHIGLPIDLWHHFREQSATVGHTTIPNYPLCLRFVDPYAPIGFLLRGLLQSADAEEATCVTTHMNSTYMKKTFDCNDELSDAAEAARHALRQRQLLDSAQASHADVTIEAALLQSLLRLEAALGQNISLADWLCVQTVEIKYDWDRTNACEFGDLKLQHVQHNGIDHIIVAWIAPDGDAQAAGVQVGDCLTSARLGGHDLPMTMKQLNEIIDSGSRWRPPRGSILEFICAPRKFGRALLMIEDQAALRTPIEEILNEAADATQLVLDTYEPLIQSLRELSVFLASLGSAWQALRAQEHAQRIAERRRVAVQSRLQCVFSRLDKWHCLWHTRKPSSASSYTTDSTGKLRFGRVPGLPAVEAIFAAASECLHEDGPLDRYKCGLKPLEIALDAESALWTSLDMSAPRQRLWKMDCPIFHKRIAGVLCSACTMVAAAAECDGTLDVVVGDTWQAVCCNVGPQTQALIDFVDALDKVRAAWQEAAPSAAVLEDVNNAVGEALRSNDVRNQASRVTGVQERQEALEGLWHTMAVLQEATEAISEWRATVHHAHEELLLVKSKLGFFTSLGKRMQERAQRPAENEDVCEDAESADGGQAFPVGAGCMGSTPD